MSDNYQTHPYIPNLSYLRKQFLMASYGSTSQYLFFIEFDMVSINYRIFFQSVAKNLERRAYGNN